MPSKHQKTLEAVFEDPVRANIHYRDLEAMFTWLGARVLTDRAGSRVAISLNGKWFSYHRPHPENEIGRKTVRDVRDFLSAAGMEP